MRKKERKLVITFHTTTDAMAMEHACRACGADGRMIPVPREITAGCGLAWCGETEDGELFREIMKKAGIREEEIRECLI